MYSWGYDEVRLATHLVTRGVFMKDLNNSIVLFKNKNEKKKLFVSGYSIIPSPIMGNLNIKQG